MKIDDYLNELCSRLTVDPLRRDEIRLETHLHLHDRTEVLRQDGLSIEDAEARAVDEFGDAETVAASLNIRQPAVSQPSFLRHGDYLAAILIYTGFAEFYANALALVSYYQKRSSFEGIALPHLISHISVICFYLIFKLIFAVALIRCRRWVRIPLILANFVMLSSIIYADALILLTQADPSAQLIRTLILTFPSMCIDLYALWVMLDLRRSHAFSRA